MKSYLLEIEYSNHPGESPVLIRVMDAKTKQVIGEETSKTLKGALRKVAAVIDTNES